MDNHWKRRTIFFFASQCVTLFGSQLVQMAIVWYVTLSTDSGAWVAAFSVCAYLPQFFISFLGGAWADRRSKKRLIIGADAMIAVVTLLMLLMMPHIAAEPAFLAALLLMSVIRSAGAGIQTPAVNAAIAQLVSKEQLVRYNGINAAMQSVVQFAAPAAAALVLTAGSLEEAFMIDIWTALVGMGMLLCIALPDWKKAQKESSAWAQIGEGMRYAHACMPVRKLLAIYGCFIFLTVPAGYLAGLLVSRVFGDTYGYLTAAELAGFGGMMAGGLLMSCWGGLKDRRIMLSAGLAFFGCMAAAMGMSRNFTAYLIFMALYGIALTAVQTTVTTMLQHSAKASMQGRVFGLMSSLYSGCYPLGMLLFGPLADHVSLRGMMAFSGLALIGMACMIYGDRQLTDGTEYETGAD